MFELYGPQFPSNRMKPGFSGSEITQHAAFVPPTTVSPNCTTTTNELYQQDKTMHGDVWRGKKGNLKGDPGWGDPLACFYFLKSLFILTSLFLFFFQVNQLYCRAVSPPFPLSPLHTLLSTRKWILGHGEAHWRMERQRPGWDEGRDWIASRRGHHT